MSCTGIADTLRGRFLYHKKDVYFSRLLEKYGEYCEDEAEVFQKFASPDGVFLDVGANLGYFSVAMSPHYAAVYAFEPQRLIYQLLCGNAALNGCINIAALRCAVGNSNEDVFVPVLDPYAENSSGCVDLREKHRGERVEQLKIDDIRFSRVDCMKIDVEGMEVEVLKGAEETIKRHRPAIYLEANDNGRRLELWDAAKSLGYRCWWHFSRHFRDENFNGYEFDGDVTCGINWLCLPAEVTLDVRMEPVTGEKNSLGI